MTCHKEKALCFFVDPQKVSVFNAKTLSVFGLCNFYVSKQFDFICISPRLCLTTTPVCLLVQDIVIRGNP
jgi:hypothetical protein